MVDNALLNSELLEQYSLGLLAQKPLLSQRHAASDA
jgi:hypothetical protein